MQLLGNKKISNSISFMFLEVVSSDLAINHVFGSLNEPRAVLKDIRDQEMKTYIANIFKQKWMIFTSEIV